VSEEAVASNSGNIYRSVVMNQYKVLIVPQAIIQSSFNQQSIGSAMNKEIFKTYVKIFALFFNRRELFWSTELFLSVFSFQCFSADKNSKFTQVIFIQDIF
jgi:hypothetical protein